MSTISQSYGFSALLRPAVAGFAAGFSVAAFLVAPRPAMAQSPTPGSIHGYVAVVAPGEFSAVAHAGRTPITPGSAIYVSDMQVVARNLSNQAVSAPVLTNAQGYFQTPNLTPGKYSVCVSALGYSQNCLDREISVEGPIVTLGQPIPIRPAGDAIIGVATLSDHKTPCFFFRPSFSPSR